MNKSFLSVLAVLLLLALSSLLYYMKNMQEWNDLALLKEQQNDAPTEETEAEEEAVVNTDSIDWMRALMENTPEAYRLYLENHVDGAHADDANEMLSVFQSTRIVRPPVDSVVMRSDIDSVELPQEPDTMTANF